MSKEKTWLDPIHDACWTVQHEAQDLRILARGFGITGNAMLCEQLNVMARTLDAAAEAIRYGVADKVSNDLTQGQQAIHDVMAAAIAGIGKPKGSKP